MLRQEHIHPPEPVRQPPGAGAKAAHTVFWYLCSTPAATLRRLNRRPRRLATCAAAAAAARTAIKQPAASPPRCLSHLQPAPHLVPERVAHPAAPSISARKLRPEPASVCKRVPSTGRPRWNGLGSRSITRGQPVSHQQSLNATHSQQARWGEERGR